MSSDSTGAAIEMGTLQAKAMQHLWRLGSSSIRELLGVWDDSQAEAPAYTTLHTVLNRLVGRGLLLRSKRKRCFYYVPAIDEQEHKEMLVRLFASTYFGGLDEFKQELPSLL